MGPDATRTFTPLRALATFLTIGWVLSPGLLLAQDGRATVRELVEAIDSGDAEQLTAFFEERLAPSFRERRSESGWWSLAERLVADLPPLDVREVRRTGDEVTLVAATGGGMPVTIQLTLDREARIAGLGISLGDHAPRSDLPPLELPDGLAPAELTERLDTWFDELEAAIGFTGSVMIARRGEPIYETARGLASRRFDVANSLETRYDVGSINKAFTRVAVGQLMAAGKLEADDTIAEHLPDYPSAEVAAKVTVQQLLDHSSGLGDFFGEEFLRSSKALYTTPESFFPLFAEEPLLFEPGDGRSYSNAGFQVLGAIIEAASGQEYHDYVRQNVFARAGMSADFLRMDEPHRDVAIGYTDSDVDGSNPDGRVRSVHYLLPVIGSPAGSSFASARDLVAFDDALREGRLLPGSWSHWFFAGEPAEAESGRLEGADYAIGIAGGAPGVSANLETDGLLTVAVLCNWGDRMAGSVALALFGALE